MTALTPRYESITGASCSGTDATTNRAYTLANSDYYSVIEVLKQGAPLHETLDFTISGGVITFLVTVWDADVISLRYFTSDAVTLVTAGNAYCTTTEVYRTSGITSSEIGTTDVSNQIAESETIICRMTKNIYWRIVLDAQTASSGGNSTITVTGAGWTVNNYANLYVWVYSGTGSVQLRKILSNTSDTLTVDRDWTTTNPAVNSKFKVFYVPTDFNPYVDEVYDGSGLTYQFLPLYPVKKVETLAVGATPTTVATTNLYLYEKTGKIQLKSAAETSVFSKTYPQEVDITYWYGVDHLPLDIKRLVELHTSIQILGQQMGGTWDDPGTVSLPEATISVGQAYINIRSSLETLKEEYVELLKTVKIWPVFAD